MSLLVIYEILGLLAKILTVYHKYSLCNTENLQESIQMQLSKEQSTLYEFFPKFLKSKSNFQHFEKKDDPHSLSCHVFL